MADGVIKTAHRYNARLLIVFLAAHLVMHLSAVFGPEVQAAALELQRPAYRNRIVEPILIALFVAQVGLGLVLLVRRFRHQDKTRWSWIQIISGGYLAIFILNHIFLGVLRGRTFETVDTGFYFVASTLVTAPLKYGFIPYYFLGVFALFCHLAAALHWSGKSKAATYGLVILGAVCGFLIVGAYSGLFYGFSLPQAYQDYIAASF